MKEEQVIEACKNKKRSKLEHIVYASLITNKHAYILLASAVVEEQDKTLGLERWKSLLHSGNGPLTRAAFINLLDLHEAFNLARKLDNNEAANRIKAFIVQNKEKLYKLFREPWNPEFRKKLCEDLQINAVEVDHYSKLPYKHVRFYYAPKIPIGNAPSEQVPRRHTF